MEEEQAGDAGGIDPTSKGTARRPDAANGADAKHEDN
jgi:hypothetical protein